MTDLKRYVVTMTFPVYAEDMNMAWDAFYDQQQNADLFDESDVEIEEFQDR